MIQEKKPFTNDRMNEYASNGTYYFRTGAIMKKYFKKLMDLEMKVKNEYYVSMVYNLLVEDGLTVNIFEIEHMLQWGTPYDLEIYQNWSNYFKNIMKKQPTFVDRLGTTTILPLAGRGSRFTKKGYKNPKPLLEVNGLPMVVQAIKCLPQSSNNIFICQQEHLNNYPLKAKLKESYPDSKIFGINHITQGQACTTEIGMKDVDLEKPILITACDNGVYYDVEKYQSLVDDENNDIIVWSFKMNQLVEIIPICMLGWKLMKIILLKMFLVKSLLKVFIILKIVMLLLVLCFLEKPDILWKVCKKITKKISEVMENFMLMMF